MADVNIEIDIREAGAIQKALNRISRAGQNLRDPLSDIGEHLLNSHRKRWGLKQSPDGAPWEPLSELYAARKRQKRPAAVILVYDDVLHGTLRYQIRGNALELGTDRLYGATHQFGRDNVPARPFLGLSKGTNATSSTSSGNTSKGPPTDSENPSASFHLHFTRFHQHPTKFHSDSS